MTARADAERRVRTKVRALDRALSEDPIDRTRVSDIATRLAEAVEGLPTDSRFEYLDRAVGALATDALMWAHFGLQGAEDDLRNTITAYNLQRRCLRVDGIATPF